MASELRPGAEREALVTLRAAQALASAGTLLLMLSAWLLVPREDPRAEPTRPALLAIVVDASLSATRPRPGWALWLRRQLAQLCERAESEGCELMLVEYADAPVVSAGPGPPSELSLLLQGHAREGEPELESYRPGASCARMRSASDLEAALALVEAEVGAPGRAPGQVLLIVDDEATGADPRFALERLARDGARIERLPLPEPTLGNLCLRELRVPRRVSEGSPLLVHAELEWQGPGLGESPLELLLELESARGTQRERRALAWPEGARSARGERVRWRADWQLDALPPGSYGLRASLRQAPSVAPPEARAARSANAHAPQDALPEDDELDARFRVSGTIACGLLAPEASLVEWRAFAQRAPAAFEALEFVELEPRELAAQLSELDCLLTLDWRTSSLPGPLLRAFVEAGGLWIVGSGWTFLNDWLPLSQLPAGDVQELLPLEPNPDDARGRDVILLVDGSGSMAGEPFEAVREAAMGLGLGALPRDDIQLRFFRGGLGEVVFESQGEGLDERRAALAPLLRASVPGGRTDILYSLEQLARLRSEAAHQRRGARDCLAILISDGRTDWSRERSREARRALAESGTRLAILAVGESLGRDFFESLLFAGEQVIEVDDYARMADLLNQTVNADRVRREPGTQALLTSPEELAPGGVARALVETMQALSGPAGQTLGAVEILARSRALREAQVLWRTSLGDPLLAVRAEGLGRVACLASAPVGEWGASFLRANPGLFATLIRSLSQPERRRPELELRFEGSQLVLDGALAGWPPAIRADFLDCRPAELGSRSEERRLLASASLFLPDRLVSASDSGRRLGLGPQAPELEARDWLGGQGQAREWRVELRPLELGEQTAGPGSVLAERALAVPRPAEFQGPWFAPHLPEALPADALRRAPAAEPSPFALPALLLGLLALFCSGLSRAGQAMRAKRRHTGASPTSTQARP